MSNVAKTRALVALLGAVAAVAALSASPSAASAWPQTMARSGTETIVATSTSRTPASVTVRASGVYKATGTFRLPVTTKATVLRFVFGTGTLTADASATSLLYHNYNCPLNVWSYRTYKISPAQSTGVFSMATGSSDYFARSTQENRRLSNGACDMITGVEPIGGTVYVSIVIEGTLTLQGHG
jgi:hypothetical protein